MIGLIQSMRAIERIRFTKSLIQNSTCTWYPAPQSKYLVIVENKRMEDYYIKKWIDNKKLF